MKTILQVSAIPWHWLLDLASDSQTPRVVRRQALFWLAHSDDDKAIAALAELLSR